MPLLYGEGRFKALNRVQRKAKKALEEKEDVIESGKGM